MIVPDSLYMVNPPSGWMRSATALLGRPASTTFAGHFLGLFALLLIFFCILPGVFFHFFGLFDILLVNFVRRCFSYFRLVLGVAPGARSTASTAAGRPDRRGKRNTCHQTGNAKPCHKTLYLILVHGITTFPLKYFLHCFSLPTSNDNSIDYFLAALSP